MTEDLSLIFDGDSIGEIMGRFLDSSNIDESNPDLVSDRLSFIEKLLTTQLNSPDHPFTRSPIRKYKLQHYAALRVRM